MNLSGIRVWALLLGFVGLFPAASALAQIPGTADYIVAVVNSEPITDSELRAALRRVAQQMKQQGQPVPPDSIMRQGVLERLISDRAQLQVAAEEGVRVDDAMVDQAEQNLARQYKTSVAELRQRLAGDGVTLAAMRADLRDQITLSRLRERDVDSQVKVTDQDVDRALAQEAAANSDPMNQEINLAQLLVEVPEHADAAQVAKLRGQAQQLLQRLRGGEDFAALVQQYSAADRANGGQLGLRRADRYPLSFVQATQSLPVGGVSDLVRSDAGFHILRVVDRRTPAMAVHSVVQTHARHILLRLGPDLTAQQALERLAQYRQRIVEGRDTFESLARQHSQDGSAEHGGDLGWAPPGMFVPEFEEAMAPLKDGEVGAPMISRFGAHLIQVIERRTVELTPNEVRDLVRRKLVASKTEEAFANWSREIRGRAYVEFRDPPH